MHKDSKILFIGPVFFNYHEHIINELKVLGFDVIAFDEKRVNLVYRLLKNISHFLFEQYNLIYEKKILKKTLEFKFDYFLLIRGEHTTIEFLDKLRNNNPNAKFIYYQWDSVKNNLNSIKICSKFDKCFTFDMKDSKNYNTFKYLPLFYLPEYKKIRESKNVITNDVVFIGTYQIERYEQVLQFNSYCKQNNIKFRYYLYLPFLQYLKLILLKQRMFLDIRTKMLSEYEVFEMLKGTKAVLDLPSVYQNGATIRTFEALAANKKVISSNLSLISEIFFNKDYIRFFNLNNEENLNLFINQETMNYDLTKICSLEQWLKKIIFQ